MAASPPHINARLTNLEKEGMFVKVHAQFDKEKAVFVEKFLFALRTVFETCDLKPSTLSELKLGLVCCAKYDEDNKYYRAKIVNMDNATRNGTIVVDFIDHGNSASVRISEVRLLSKLKTYLELPEDASRVKYLEELPPLAQDFLLCGIPRKELDDESIEFLKSKLVYDELQCSVSDYHGKRVLRIHDPKRDPLNLLQEKANMEKAIPRSIPSNPQRLPTTERFNTAVPPPSVLQQPPPLSKHNFAMPPPSVRAPQPEANAPLLSQSVHQNKLNSVPGGRLTAPGVSFKELPRQSVQSSQPPQLRNELLAPGATYPVFVSFVEDGPHTFAVQIQDEVALKLTGMMAAMNARPRIPITEPLNFGSFCLAKYSDGILCRGVVTNVTNDKVKVYFIDFGNSEILEHSNIFKIAPEFLNEKVMSHRFSLAKIKDKVYSEVEKKAFRDIVNNCREIVMQVTAPEDNKLIQYCELYVRGKNIKSIMEEVLLSQPLLRYIPLSLPVKGSQEKVYVTFVINPGRFFVQLDKNSFTLQSIMSVVADHCRTASHIPLSQLRVGEPCCAMYPEDETWYRGEILKITLENKAFVNFVDYGNQDDVELENLRVSTPELVQTVKAQALACCLLGYESRYNVEEETSNRLEEMILEKNLMMHVVGYTPNKALIVQLFDSNGKDIGKLLEAPPTPTPAVYNDYQASVEPAATHSPVVADDGWEDQSKPTGQANKYEDRNYSDSRAQRSSKGKRSPQELNHARDRQQVTHKHQQTGTKFHRDDNKKSWRSRDEDRGEGRWNDNAKPERKFGKDDEDKSWNKEGRGRFNNRDEEGTGRFNNRDDNRGRFNNEDKPRFTGGSRFNDEEKPRFGSGGRFNDEEKPRFGSGGRFNDEDKPRFGGRSNDDEKPRFGGRFEGDEKPKYGGNRFGDSNREEGGGRFNRPDGERPFRRRDDDSGGVRRNNDDRGYKPRGNWNEGSGDSSDRFSRGGFNRDSQGERSSFHSKPWEKGSSGGFGSSKAKTPKPNSIGGMPQSEVKVGTTQDSQVVYTTSPHEFYIQLTSSFEELNQLMEKIANACESGTVNDMTDLKAKNGCLAKYSEDDTWYRAVIEEIGFDNAKVLFVDYGNQENVSNDKVKELPEDMSLLPVQAVKCRLFGIPESAEVEPFSTLVDGKTLKTHFIAKNFLNKSLEVVLIDEENGTNINTVMGASEEEVQTAVSKLGMVTPTYQQLAPGNNLATQVTWYLSPAEFYLQVLSSHPEFRAMMQSMQAVQRSGQVKQNNDLTAGDFVIAKFKADKVLYRAIVMETGFAPTVQYVDYGNTEAVDSGAVWQMETEFATLPVQAFCCRLAGVQPTGEAWPKEGTSALDQQFEADSVECSIIGEVESQYIVKLNKNGQDVAQSIIEAGLAVPSTEGAATELDTNLLINQYLPVTILKVEDAYSFFIQPAAELVELQSLETVCGEGIKCSLSNVRGDATEEQISQFKKLPASTNVILRVDAVTSEGLQVTLYDAEGQLLPLQACETSAVEKVCPLPILNANQKVYVAHASDEGIYLQKSALANILPELLQKLYEYYNDLQPVEEDWKEGDFCCAKSVNDEQWYRARVTEAGEEFKVQYIDYGNSETVPITNLKSLDSSFYIPHAMSVKVSLHVAWTVPIENILEIAGETEYNAVVLKTDEGWLVELVDGSGQSLTEKLVELGFATALENSPFKRVVEGGRFVEGSDVSVSVSFIDSPLQLWIFIESDIEQVEALQDRLQEAAPKLPSLSKPNGIFASKFSDDLWYRAIRLDDSTVRFIDYGNSDVVNMSDIKSLPADFLEPAEGYAVKVELPIASFKESATERLNELLISEEIESTGETVAHILSVRDSFIVADILKGGKSIVDTLVEENLATRFQKVFSGFISHFNSLNDFSVQEVGCEECLESISNIMLTAESFEPVVEQKEGDLVGALYNEDGLWYRARITKLSDEEIQVLFVDYGNTAAVSELKKLPSSLESIAPQSIQCALTMPNGVKEWSESANKQFVELSAEGTTQFDVKVLNQENPVRVILCHNGKSLHEELKPLCDACDLVSSTESSFDLTGYDNTVYISHVNSARDFYVQLDGAETELESIRKELDDTSSFEKLDQLTADLKGKIVGALFVDDDLWYRAKIIDIAEEEAEVLFVDYGNSAVAKQFVKLPESLVDKLPVTLHCTLDGNEIFSEEANNAFVEMSGEGTVPFFMKILNEGELNVVSLVHENKIVEKELLSFGAAKEIEVEAEIVHDAEDTEMIKLSEDPNLIKSVYLIQVISPSDFFLHTSEATQLISEISERLTTAEEFPSVEEESLTQGKIVAAQIDEDDLWYRAKILEHCDSEIKVLFVDYGNTAKVARIKTLPDDLVSTPPLAMHCSLNKEGGGEWSIKARESFSKIANEDGVSFDLKIVSEGEPFTVELYINGKSVGKQIIAEANITNQENAVDNQTSNADDMKVLKTDDSPVKEKHEDVSELVEAHVITDNLNNTQVDSHDEIRDENPTSYLEESVEKIHKSTEDANLTEDIDSVEKTDNIEKVDQVNDISSSIEDHISPANALSVASNETLQSSNMKDEQNSMAEMVLQSVEKQISHNLEKDIKEITDCLIENVTESVKEVPSVHNESSLQCNGTSESNPEEDYKSIKENIYFEEANESQFASPESATSANSTIVNDEVTTDHLEEKSTELDKIGSMVVLEEKQSPSTPRRSNIDEHIVPGCISIVAPEDSSKIS